jgi:hypothetical protein
MRGICPWILHGKLIHKIILMASDRKSLSTPSSHVRGQAPSLECPFTILRNRHRLHLVYTKLLMPFWKL